MPDDRILKRIQALVLEEQRLRDAGTVSDADREQLRELEVELDQYWDLLRRRRAYREFGDDPAQAQVRPAKVVEKYEG